VLPLTVASDRATRIQTDILVLGIFSDERPLPGLAGEVDWFTCGILSRLIRSNKITGVFGEQTLLATERKLPAPKVLIAGLGERARFDRARLRQLCRALAATLAKIGARDCALELFGQAPGGARKLSDSDAIEEMVAAFKGGSDPLEADLRFVVIGDERAQTLQRRLRELAGHA
jgi:hypothetical protein